MREAGHTKSVLWDKPEGQGGKGDERGVQDGGDRYVPMAHSHWYMENHHNIVK